MEERWTSDAPAPASGGGGARGPRPGGRDRRARPARPAGQARRQPRRAGGADRAVGVDLRRPAAAVACAPACSSAPATTGTSRRGTSLYGADVSAQVAAAAARGETAVGVLARQGGHELLVADVGLAAPTPAGVRDVKVRPGTADMARRPGDDARASSTPRWPPARRSPAELTERGADCLVLGEIGMGNTATTAALACALTGAAPSAMVGRGTGLDAAGRGAQARPRRVCAGVARRSSALRATALDARSADSSWRRSPAPRPRGVAARGPVRARRLRGGRRRRSPRRAWTRRWARR